LAQNFLAVEETAVSKTTINPETLFNSLQYGFSQIVVAQGQRTVHFSGQVAWDEHENIVGANDLRAQVWQSLRNVETAVTTAGATLNDIVALRIYIVQSWMDRTAPVSEGLKESPTWTRPQVDKAQVGIASVWYEGNTCNMHLNDLAAVGQRRAWWPPDLVGMRFNTIGVSDGISMGTDGMSYSLQSRDLIADSIETVMGAQWYDANIAIPAATRTCPAA
jgi:dihydroxyacid dehydratase/phosphogluconate dehydratase